MKIDMKDFLYNLAVNSGGGGYPEPTGTKNITQNGNNIDVKDYAAANVNVPNSYTAQDEGKVVSNGALVSQTSRNITQNGTVDTTLNDEVVVNVPSQTPTLVSKSITANGRYVATDDDADGYSEVTVAVQAESKENDLIQRTIAGEYTNAGITAVSSYAFVYCGQLTGVSFPNVTAVQSEGLAHNSRLASVYLPKLVSIGNKAFADCPLTDANFPLVTSVQDYVFQGCLQLKTVSLPLWENKNHIGTGIFDRCIALKNVSLPKVTYLSSAFTGCTQLESIDLPEVTGMYSVFSGCSALESVNLPKVTNCYGYNFRSCRSLVSIDLPMCTELQSSEFQGCTKLKNINIPLVTKMGSSCFNNCSEIETIDLPSVTNMNSSGMFANCSMLTALIVRSTAGVVPIYSASFYGTPIASGTGYIYVPASLIDAYKVASNWSPYANQFRALEDYTVDGTTTGALDSSKI